MGCRRRRIPRQRSLIRHSGGRFDPGLGRLTSTRHAQATRGKSGARSGLGGARHGEGRTARRRIAGARAQGLLGCAIGYTSRSKRKSGWGRSSPRLETSVGGSCRGSGGEDRRRVAAAFGDGSVRGCPGLRVSTGRRGVVL